MKNLTFVLFLILVFFSSCGSEGGKKPVTVAEKKEAIRAKREQLKSLEAEITQLKNEVADMDPSAVEKMVRTVIIDTIGIVDVNRVVDIQAQVQANESVNASSETGGRITRLTVEEGQHVRKGKLIATIDMESVNKQIAELQTSLSLVEDVFQRQSMLWNQNIGSEIQYLEAKNNKERLEKSLETARYQLTKANVYAPISGVVDMVVAEAGEMTGPGAPIANIINTYSVKVVANAPERYLPIIKNGQKVKVKFPAIQEERMATISSVGRTINPANRTFEVEVQLSNKDGILKPNLLAIMEVEDYAESDVITVPLSLVQQEITGKDYVFVMDDKGNEAVAKKVYVEMGERTEGQVVIESGLEKGDLLIVEGARGLAPGELVELSAR